MAGTLILVRHGQSEWNLKNLFTGWKNPDLTEAGVAEALATGRMLSQRGYVPDAWFTSALRRAQHTLDLILEEMGIEDVVIARHRRSTARLWRSERAQQGRGAPALGRGAGPSMAPLL